MKSPPQILAHNILRAIVGFTDRPLIQPEILIASNSLPATISGLTKFFHIHTGTPTHPPSLDNFIKHSAEWQSTIIPVLSSIAYHPTTFNAAHFGDGLTDPLAWLSGSYYRLANLIHFADTHPTPSYLESAIRVLAATEAAECHSAFTNLTITPDIILFDPDIFARESGEDSGDII